MTDQPSPPTYYAAVITCVSCQTSIGLPYAEGPPTRGDHARLARRAREEHHWTLMRGGAWVCSELRYVQGGFMCKYAARRFARIRAAAIRHKKRGGQPLKPINPEYFGKVTISNLETP